MPLVNVMVNQRAYTIACDNGEEDHLRELAKHVDGKVRELLESVGHVGDNRLILMAALLITDEYFDALARLENSSKETTEPAVSQNETKAKAATTEANAIAILESATKRLNDIAARLTPA